MPITKQLLCVSWSGMADRIRLLIAGRKLAQATGRSFGFGWLRNLECGADFDDLFTMGSTLGWWRAGVCDKMPELLASAYFDGYTWSRMPWSFAERQIRACDADHITLHHFADDCDHNFEAAGIDFSEKVKSRAREICGVVGTMPPNRIGVHVRMSDYHEFASLPALADYFGHVDRLLAKDPGKIFLACHTRAVRTAFVERYGDSIMPVPWRKDEEPNRITRQGMIDATAELAVLRQCRRKVLSIFSGFSAMAIVGPGSVKGKGIKVIE